MKKLLLLALLNLGYIVLARCQSGNPTNSTDVDLEVGEVAFTRHDSTLHFTKFEIFNTGGTESEPTELSILVGNNSLVYFETYLIPSIAAGGSVTILPYDIDLRPLLDTEFIINKMQVSVDIDDLILESNEINNSRLITPDVMKGIVSNTILRSYYNQTALNLFPRTIEINIESGAVDLALYNLTGRQVIQYSNAILTSGSYSFNNEFDTLENGYYICRLLNNNMCVYKQIAIAK